MYRTMRGLVATLVMLLGALAVTGLLAAGLQDEATAGHHVDEDFLPGGEAATDHWGSPSEPRAVRTDQDTEKAKSRPTSEGSAGPL